VLVVGGIYSPNHQSGRWGRLLSKGAPDSPVRQPRHPTVRVRPLELLTCGPPYSPVVHRTITVHCPVRLLAPALTLRVQSALFTVHFLQSTVGAVAVTPLGTTDSPVLHRTVRCASHVTQPLGFDRWSSDKWGHRTVRWCTG
jgi:hypothetical protein